MTQEELMNELLSKLPAEIVEKINANTITEEELQQYVQPLAEQYKDKIEGFAQLSEEDLENVNGGREPNFFDHLLCIAKMAAMKYETCIERVKHPELRMMGGWR